MVISYNTFEILGDKIDRICFHRWEIRKGVKVDSQISGLDRFVDVVNHH